MPNVYNERLWIIDTASATAITQDRVDFDTIRWIGASNAAHTVSITDAAGNVVWAAAATSADHSEESVARVNCKGLIVPTLGSGILYLYHRQDV